MELLPYERRRLDCLEGDLRAEEPGLASKFDLFTRLARGEGRPPTESQFLMDGPWRETAFARQSLRRYLVVIAAVVLALFAGVFALSFT